MPTMRTSGELIASIQSDLADNNAGLISAYDVRSNLEDTVFSINSIVASGDTDVAYPFYNDVRAKQIGGNGGLFIPESGLLFPNSPIDNTSIQTDPWLGPGNIQHNDLAGLTDADPHTQYLPVGGTRPMTGNLPVGNNWIGASGNSNIGFKFVPNASATEDIYTSGDLVFGDNSRIPNTAKGVAKAWLNFDASGVGNIPVVRSYYNIDSVHRLEAGKLKIFFASGTFLDNNYVAIGNANATTSSGSMEDFDVNTVGLVLREGDDAAILRSITYVIRNDAGLYVDSQMCDFVAYGYEPLETSGTVPTVIGL